MSSAGAVLVVDKLLNDLGADLPEPLRRSAASIARTIRDLRNSGAVPGSLARRSQSDFRKAVTRIYCGYLDYLVEAGLLDEAGLFREASVLLDSAPDVTFSATVLIMDDVELTHAALQFVRSLQRHTTRFCRIGMPDVGPIAPPHVVRSNLADWPVPPVSRIAPPGPSDVAPETNRDISRRVDIIRAIGSDNEVRAVFRRLVREKFCLDEVEIAYTANHPYLGIIRSMAARYDLPLTLAAGIPALSTRPGRAVVQFLDWMSTGCPSVHLSLMIKEGTVVLPDADGDLHSGSFPTVLDLIQVRGGLSAYDRLIQHHRDDRSGDGLNAAGFSVRRLASIDDVTFRQVLRRLRPLVSLADCPATMTMRQLTERIGRFIYEWVLAGEAPAAPAPEGGAGNGSIETAAGRTGDADAALDHVVARDLITRFRQLADAVEERLPTAILVNRLRELLTEAFVRARAALPGHLHIVPLSSAGLSGRPRLFILGLDELTLGRAAGEDPLLDDSERVRISIASGNRLGLSSDTLQFRSWAFARAVRRAIGPITLVYSTYDVAEDRELFPSSIVLAYERIDRDQAAFGVSTGQEDRLAPDPESWVPAGPNPPLDWTEVFLAASRQPDARRSCDEHFPWTGRGRQAVSARRSDAWTAFDGLLGGKAAALNTFRSVDGVSPSRLEVLAACPFRYFVRHLLGVQPPEPFDEDEWINAMQRGSLVHDVLARFMQSVFEKGETVRAADLSTLEKMFIHELERWESWREPPSQAAVEASRTELLETARAFIEDELLRSDLVTPLAFELEFGMPGTRSASDGATFSRGSERVELDLNGLRFALRGRVDRIDRMKEGGLSITDYKTGSSSSFDPRDLLGGGRTLQWALYAYAVESLYGEAVRRSGYLFPNSREMGLRMEDDPAGARAEIAQDLQVFDRMGASGYYLQAAEKTGVCTFCDYQKICGDIPQLEECVGRKLQSTAPTSAAYPLLEGWRYARKKLGGGS